MPVVSVCNVPAGRVVIERPGLYPLTADLGAIQPADRWLPGVRVALLVCHLGDFVVTRVFGLEPRARSTVRLNGRLLLGDLERLSEDVLLDVSDGESACCLEYVHADGPAIAFAMPASSLLRCAYSYRSLSKLTAIRCGGCYRLFSKDAWEQLDRECPSCHWKEGKVHGGEHCESAVSRLW